MKISRLEKVYIIALMVIFGGIILHAPLSVALGTLFPDYVLLIKTWKEIILISLLPIAAILITRRKLWVELARDWLLRIIFAYTLLHLVLVALFYEGAKAAAAGLAIDLRYLVFFVLVYVAIRLMPTYRRQMIYIGIIGACIVVGFAALQLFLPADILSHIGYGKDTIMPYLTVDMNPDYIRVNSTLRGPNPVGAYAGMVLVLVTAAIVRGRVQWQNKKHAVLAISLALCATVALWISYSRSALVAGIIGVVIVLAVTIAPKLSRRSWIITVAVICSIVGGLVAARDSSFVSNVLLHENPNGGSRLGSNEEHVTSLETGTERLFAQPFGGGVGSTGSASLYGDAPIIIENQYLFVAHETGWLGLLLFIALFGLILRRLWQNRKDWLSLGVFASGTGIALIGLLLPVWTDDTVSIIWWGFAALALSKGNHERYKTK